MKKKEKIITILLLPIIVISLFIGNSLISNVKPKSQTKIEQKNTIYNEPAEVKAVFWTCGISGWNIKSLKELLELKKLDITNVTKIIFNDISSTKQTYTGESKDMSYYQDNSVQAIVNGDTLYIQYEGTLFLNRNSSYLFAYLDKVISITGLEYVDTSNVTDMSYMFRGCSGLTSLDLSNFDTSNVTDMSGMFRDCSGLTSLDVSNFNTSNVTDMGWMFGYCSSLTSLDVSNFDTSNVTNMYDMFWVCRGLTNLDVSNFDTSNVTTMHGMFEECTNLTSLNVSNFDTSNVTDMGWMFHDCSGLTSLDLSNFDTSNVTEMYGMFGNCTNLTSLDLSNFDTSNVTTMHGMFKECTNLTSLNVSNFDTSNVTSMWQMFYNCSRLTSLDVSNFDTSNVETMREMFDGCSGLTSLDVSNFDTSNVTNMSYMFRGCSGLTSLDLSNFDTSNVTDMGEMFYNCSRLTSLDVSSFDTSNVTNMSYMFRGCSGLTSLDVSSFDTSNVTNMSYMFNNCSSLTSINVSNFDTSNVTNMRWMFRGCSNLTSLDVSNFDTSNVTNMSYMFRGCSGLTSLDVSNFDTSNVTDMHDMFSDCSGLTSLDLSNFDTSNVTDMHDMFSDCSGLTSLDVSNFNTSNVTNMSGMFQNDKKLEKIYVGALWNTGNAEDKITIDNQGMFYNCISLVGGNGTKYSKEHPSIDYAVIDNEKHPGYLTSAMFDLKIEYYYAYNTNKVVKTDKHEVLRNSEYSYDVEFPNKNYRPDKPTVSGTMSSNNTTVKVILNPINDINNTKKADEEENRYKLNVKYYYEGDNTTVVREDNYEVLELSNYDYEIKNIPDGYYVNETSISGTMPSKDLTVKIIYHKNKVEEPVNPPEEKKKYKLNVKYYYEEDSNTVVREDNYDVLEQSKYSYPITSIPSGYYVNETSVSGTMPSKDLTVKIIYHKNKVEEPVNPPEEKKKYKLTIKYYYEEDTSKVVNEETHDVLELTKYNYEIKNVPSGYYVNETSVSGTMPSKDLTVKIIYHKNKVEEPVNPPVEGKYYTLTIEYYYAYDINKVIKKDTHDIIENKDYSYEVKNIPEYYKVDNNVVSGVMPSKNTTVKVVYKPINDINNTNRADEEEKYILRINYTYNNNNVKSETISILGGTQYNVDLKVPENYTADTNNISGTMSFKDEEVNILLKPKATLLGNNTSSNGELVNPKTGNTKLIIIFIIVIGSILLVLKNRKKITL